MGHFYFDESIQERGGFIIGAFVFASDDITPAVFAAIEAAKLQPRVDEFKSGARMDRNPKQLVLRGLLSELLATTQVGVVVIPNSERELLGFHAILALRKFLVANSFESKRHEIYFDEGISIYKNGYEKGLAEFGEQCNLHQSQDSKIIGGIQIADLAAHCLGGMLLEQLGLVAKMVKVRGNSGHEPDSEVELGFELWASLRYQFFRAPEPLEELTSDGPRVYPVFDVANYGLYIADKCSALLREAALNRFGTNYLGCIH